MNYYIFRHAETYFSKFNLHYGNMVENAEILPEGIPAIKRLADHLKTIKTDKNYTSPYKRCLQTVGIINKITGWIFNTDDRLHDYNRNIETIPEMIQRIERFHNEINQSGLKVVAVCTHGYPISALIQLITKDSVSIPDLDNYPKSGVLTIIKNKKIEEIDFSED